MVALEPLVVDWGGSSNANMAAGMEHSTAKVNLVASSICTPFGTKCVFVSTLDCNNSRYSYCTEDACKASSPGEAAQIAEVRCSMFASHVACPPLMIWCGVMDIGGGVDIQHILWSRFFVWRMFLFARHTHSQSRCVVQSVKLWGLMVCLRVLDYDLGICGHAVLWGGRRGASSAETPRSR